MDSSEATVPKSSHDSMHTTPEDPGKGDNRDNQNHDDHTLNPPQSPVDLLLDFLSKSSNGTLLCAYIISIIAAFVILGHVGLLVIGTVLGIILHASWEGTRNDTERRKDVTSEVSKGLLAWPQRNALGNEEEECTGTESAAIDTVPEGDMDYSIFPPAAAAALRSLTDATIDNYVK